MLRPALVFVALLAVVLAGANWPPTALGDARADRVVVDKSDRVLRLMDGDAVLAEYRVSLGAAPEGHKQREGDERTPEGVYALDWRNADSCCFRSIRVSYPSPADLARAQAVGDDPGGMIMIHGIQNGLGWLGRLHRVWDWTDGCIAVTNAEMAQIWAAVPTDAPIEIRP